MVAPMVLLKGASVAAQVLGGLLNRGNEKAAARMRQQIANEQTALSGREFDLRLGAQRAGNLTIADLIRGNTASTDALVRDSTGRQIATQAQRSASATKFGLDRADAAGRTARDVAAARDKTARDTLDVNDRFAREALSTREDITRRNLTATEAATLAQVDNARRAREASLAASAAGRAQQQGYQNQADGLADIFAGQVGAGQNAADRAASVARRDATTAAAVSGPMAAPETPVTDDATRAEFARQQAKNLDLASATAAAGNRVSSYGDANFEADVRTSRFNQGVSQIGLQADYAKAALPSRLSAIQAEAEAGDATAKGALDIITAFNDATGAARLDDVSARGDAALEFTGATGQNATQFRTGMGAAEDRQLAGAAGAADARFATEQSLLNDYFNNAIGTSQSRFGKLTDAEQGFTQGQVNASTGFEGVMGDIAQTRINGVTAKNKLGSFLTTAGNLGMAATSIASMLPRFDAGAAMAQINATPKFIPATAISNVRGANMIPMNTNIPRI